MKQYLDLVKDILDNGVSKGDRTGTGTLSVFGRQLRFDLSEGLPVVTTKRVSLWSVIHELLWFISGSEYINYLARKNVHIWDAFAHQNKVGPMYGSQWNSRDQLQNLINTLVTNSNSRRMLVSCWEQDDLPDESISPQENVRRGKMALAPCHVMFQCYVANGKLSLQVYQRSSDMFLGVPFNLASYGILTHMLAKLCGLQPGELIWTSGDTHIYLNHIEQLNEQLTREPRPLPTVEIVHRDLIQDFTYPDILIRGYQPHPPIKGEISV